MQRSLRVLLMLLFVGAAVSASPAQAQQEISGTVTDAQTGETLPGATVSVVGTTAGTATDMNGAYTLNAGADADSLRFSFVGYDAQTVAIAGRSVIDVALMPSTQQLDDLVVIGYGSVEERDLTGSVSRVSAADFNPAANASPEEILSGKVPGVQISQSSGAPGASPYIRIRGATSFEASSRPLFVVDGVPISNDDNTAQRNPLAFLNPDDIENVTVLKDASSTAIYGSRGANGVILIETKNAVEGEAEITYSGSASAANPINNIDVLDARQFRNVVTENEPQQLSRLGVASTDWIDATQRTAYAQEHSLSVTRGYEDSNLRLAFGYLDQEGVLQSSSFERVNGSVNYDVNLLDDQVTVTSSLRGVKTTDVFEPGGMLGSAASFAPTQPIRDVNSEFGGFFEWSGSDQALAENNPVAQFIYESNRGETFRGIGNVDVTYRLPFVDGLNVRAKGGVDIISGERELFAPTFLKGQAESDDPGRIERANFTRTSELFNFFVNYKNEFEGIQSKVDATAVYEFLEEHEEYPELFGQGLSSNAFGPNSGLAIDSPENSGFTLTEIPSRLISVLGRVNYTFMDRYLLTVSVRRDGSSRFGPGNRYGTFPSAAFAWRAHQEAFLEDVDLINNLKFRVAYGIVGNQEFGDFRYATLYTPGGPRAQIQFGDDFVNTLRPSAADENLQWEETTSLNVGVDYGLLDNRLNGSVEFYRQRTDNLLSTVPVPAGSNLSNFVTTNIGSMRNDGVELNLNAVVLDGDNYSYDANFNFSHNRNEVLELSRDNIDTGGIDGATGLTIQIIQEGQPINSFFVYQHKRDDDGNPLPDGVDHNDDGTVNDLDLYRDVNGDETINEEDRVVDGSPQPDFVLGHTSQARYGNFDFSFTLRAHLGAQVYNNIASNFGRLERLRGTVPSNLHSSVLDYGFTEGQFFSDVYVENADFLRMDNITLGYTIDAIPSVRRVRVYGSINNAFVLTGYSGTDPEVGGSGELDATQVGIDNNTYPRARTFTAGVSVNI